METVIRHAEIQDLEDIYLLEASCFPVPWSRKSFEDLISSADGGIICAIGPNDELLGFLGYLDMYDSVHVANIAVKETARRNGIASKLLEFLIDSCKDRTFGDITLEVRHDNANAIALYKKYGFETEGKRLCYYDDGADAYIMWLRNDKAYSYEK